MACLGGAAVLALKTAAGRTGADDGIATAGWEVTVAPREQAAAAYTQAETLARVRPLFGRELHVVEPEGTLLYPVAASARDYFAMTGTRLTLESPSARGMERLNRLDVSVPARREVAWLSRRLRLGVEGSEAMVVPPLPRTGEERERFVRMTGINLEQGAWVEGGYVAPGAGHGRELFTTWARRHEDIAAGAAAWYELRFEAERTYFCRDGGKRAGEGEKERAVPLRVIDFGAGASGVP
jgi:hypothetical protein